MDEKKTTARMSEGGLDKNVEPSCLTWSIIYWVFFIHVCAGLNTGSQNCMLKFRLINCFDRKRL